MNGNVNRAGAVGNDSLDGRSAVLRPDGRPSGMMP